MAAVMQMAFLVTVRFVNTRLRFKIQEWFIAISTEIYMAYIPRLKPRWAYFPKYNQIELHNIDLFGTTG